MNPSENKSHPTWRDVILSYEVQYIKKSLTYHNGNKTQTAKSLNISRDTIYNILEHRNIPLIDLPVEYNPFKKWDEVKRDFEVRCMSMLIKILEK